MTDPTSGFDLVVDLDDRPVSMVNITRIGAGTAPALEPLLQRHVMPLTTSPGDDAPIGVVVGMMVATDHQPAARAVTLRHILTTAVTSGRVIVSTPWLPYQRLSMRLGLRQLGETRDDFFRCGRRSGIFSRAFTPGNLPPWLRQLERGATPRSDDALAGAVRGALSQLREPHKLAGSPLLAVPGLSSPQALVAFIQREIESLACSESPVDTDAARILSLSYLRRSGGHEMVANRLHLSRATYFRRLDHGVRHLTEAVRWLTAAPDVPT